MQIGATAFIFSEKPTNDWYGLEMSLCLAFPWVTCIDILHPNFGTTNTTVTASRPHTKQCDCFTGYRNSMFFYYYSRASKFCIKFGNSA